MLGSDVCNTSLGVKPEESLPSTLAVRESGCSPNLARVSSTVCQTSSHFVPTGGHIGPPPPIARRIFDPCGVLGHTNGRFRELSTGRAQNATGCKDRFPDTVTDSNDVLFCQVALI